MNIKSSLIAFSITIICSVNLLSQSMGYRRSIPPEELKQDFEVLKNVLKNYHPGLYRYQDSATVEKHFTALQQELNRHLSTTEFYIILSRFTAQLQCGHTFCSYYNQNKTLKDSIFDLSDKVPFTFFLFEKQMLLDKDLSEMNLKEGSQVMSINNVPAATLIDSLLPYVKGDGSNDGQRLYNLALTGLGKYEAFDIYFPLLFPPENATYTLEIKKPGDSDTQTVSVKSISRAERFLRMEQKYGKQPETYDDLWRFDLLNEKTAYLQLGTFVTNKLSLDWKKFLANAFEEVNAKNVPNLILDIRGNEGGDDEVNLVLANYLARKAISFPEFKELLTYEKVADEVRPYLSTWDNGFYDRSGKVVSLNNGFYTWKKDRRSKVIPQKKNAYTGKLFLLVDAANSSATFFLASGLQQNELATLIGTETGGNRQGTNGGNLFFLRLPNSRIEIDVPLIGYYPLTEQPDEGLMPDMLVTPSLEDLLQKRDAALEKTLELIDQK